MTRINTNVSSIIAQGRLRTNTGDLQTRLERLATGLRINRGKDDPAGLIASEILRSEISAIGQAIDNSQRAINVISTAEGAINETSRLLLDLRSLIVNTANEGALSDEEIEANQLEIDNILADQYRSHLQHDQLRDQEAAQRQPGVHVVLSQRRRPDQRAGEHQRVQRASAGGRYSERGGAGDRVG
jgi:hypothetical protein